MKMKLVSLIALVLLARSTSTFPQSIGWSMVNAKIEREFPDVPRISTKELADWVEDSKKAKPILLDVRTSAEFEVSHLDGAKRIEPDSDVKTVSLPQNKPIVTYCSVGYRSAVFAKKLRDAGYTHVFNLEGSIFRWANENRPLRHDGQPTDKVHPYNGLWGMLVDKSHRAAVSSSAKSETPR